MNRAVSVSVLSAILSVPLWCQNSVVPDSILIPRTIKAIGYKVGGGSTKVDMKNCGVLPGSGEAKVEAKPGATTVELELLGLRQPTQIGSEFLTYVLWAVSPDGRASSLGEVIVDDGGKAKLKATTPLQSFSLFVSAEPYSAVSQPSEVLVMENEIRKDTKGKIFLVNDYKLMRRSQYERLGNPLALGLDLKNVPIQMYEARNAVEIAKTRKAPQYAPEVFKKAESSLKMAENALIAKQNKKDIISLARQTAQFSEDARSLSVSRQEQERIENERLDAAAKAKAAAEARAAAEAAEAKRKADEEARRQAELVAAREAKAKAENEAREARLKADADAKEAKLKAEADIAAAKAKAEADALKAREDAARADAERARQAAEQLRAQLLQQFNRILETQESPRGLVITMGDVLFDTGKHDLRPPTRELLAKISGIVLAHQGLHLQVEGHTDSVGGDDFNQKLSEQRAGSVREYFVAQGLDGNSITAKGFGKTTPVATNDTPAGRQKNRRVELVVSGEVIGIRIGN